MWARSADVHEHVWARESHVQRPGRRGSHGITKASIDARNRRAAPVSGQRDKPASHNMVKDRAERVAAAVHGKNNKSFYKRMNKTSDTLPVAHVKYEDRLGGMHVLTENDNWQLFMRVVKCVHVIPDVNAERRNSF